MFFLLFCNITLPETVIVDHVELIEFHSYYSTNGFMNSKSIIFWGNYTFTDGHKELHVVTSPRIKKTVLIYESKKGYVLIWREGNIKYKVYTKEAGESVAYESKGEEIPSTTDRRTFKYKDRRKLFGR